MQFVKKICRFAPMTSNYLNSLQVLNRGAFRHKFNISITYCDASLVQLIESGNLIKNGSCNEGNDKKFTGTFIVAGLLTLLGFKEDENNSSQTAEEKIIHTIKLAKLSQQREDFKKAEQFFHLALRMAHDFQHNQAQIYIVDELANNAYELGDFRKAEKLFKETLKNLLANGISQDDNSIIHISAKLAKIYVHLHDDSKAAEGFRFCVDHIETKVKSGSNELDTLSLYTLILCWCGEFEFGRRAFPESLQLFQKAHNVSVDIHGPNHHHSLYLLNSMAASFSMLNKLDEAVACLKKLITLAREYSTDDDGVNDIPYFYINLTNIYLTQLNNQREDNGNILKEALDSCQEALLQAKKIGDREAQKEAEKCMATIKQYQT